MPSQYLALKLDEESRKRLLTHCSPLWYEDVRADHVTLSRDDYDVYVKNGGKFRVGSSYSIDVVAYVANHRVDCVLARIEGTSDREDKKLFHITLSVAQGHSASDSNLLLEDAFEREMPMRLMNLTLFGKVQLLDNHEQAKAV